MASVDERIEEAVAILDEFMTAHCQNERDIVSVTDVMNLSLDMRNALAPPSPVTEEAAA